MLCIIFTSVRGIHYALEFKSDWHASHGSAEKMTLISGIHFAENGFLSNAGLQYQCGNQTLLSSEDDQFRSDKCVNTHNPPLPDWIAGLLIKIMGKEKIHNDQLLYFRFFPVTTGILSLMLFAYMTFSTFDAIRSTVIVASVSFVKMISYMMGHLNMHSYNFSLLILQFGVLFYIFKKETPLKMKYFIIMFLLGFLQGWLSYDYFFLVSFSAIPFALIYTHMNRSESKKRFFYAILFPLIGFGLAHFLHFIQAVVYFGGINEAYNNIIEIVQYRLGESQESEISRLRLLHQYFLNQWKFLPAFAVPFDKFILLIFILTCLKDVRININKPFQAVLKWTSSHRSSFAILAALLISSLFIVTIKQYISYLPRHFFLLYFVSVLTVLENISVESINSSADITYG